MANHILEGARWFLQLFDPPPLDSMNWRQKVGRIVLVSVSLVTTCIVMAMAMAVLVFLEEKGRRMLLDTPHLLNGLLIVFTGIAVNTGCVLVLLMIRRMDSRLMNGHKPADGDHPIL